MFFSVLVLSTALLNGTAPGQPVPTADAIDTDRDGISDEQEQFLLEKFRPAFMISRTDCAGLPARFKPDYPDPNPLAADGTIYGQVFPVSGNRIEIHYYTLWERDCGRMKHPLDAEHVSVLISMDSEQGPKALYWYAGAHEKTACDMSSGGPAEALTTVAGRPAIWSSSGKHALFLRREMCGEGCGADSCTDNIELPKNGPVMNIGELGRPMNGATWETSTSWPLADKMNSDFSTEVLARLETAPPDTISTIQGSRAIRGTIEGADATVDGAAIGAHQTQAALNTANGHTSKSLSTATKATGRALRHAWDSVFARD
jgi:hypothetical protein